MHNLYNTPKPPFVTGYALQEYLSAEEGILAARDANCSHWYIDGSLSSESPSHWDDARINSLLKSINEYKVYPIYHGNFKVPLASDVLELRRTAIEYTKKEIDLAAKLNSGLIIHGGAIVEPRLVNKLKKLAIDNYLDSINYLADYAASKNVSLFLENLSNYKHYKPFHYIFTQLEEFDFILEKRTDVKFMFDIGHANIGEGDPIAIIEKYHARMAAMSLSNNDGNRDQHLALASGTIDYKKVISTILACKWQGIVAFETRGRSASQSTNDLYYLYQQVAKPALRKTILMRGNSYAHA